MSCLPGKIVRMLRWWSIALGTKVYEYSMTSTSR